MDTKPYYRSQKPIFYQFCLRRIKMGINFHEKRREIVNDAILFKKKKVRNLMVPITSKLTLQHPPPKTGKRYKLYSTARKRQLHELKKNETSKEEDH